jgi:hypothetical protein
MFLFLILSEQNASHSEESEKCLRYIRALSWPKLKEWLLEQKNVAGSNDVSHFIINFKLNHQG